MSLSDEQLAKVHQLFGRKAITDAVMDEIEAILGGEMVDWRFNLDWEVKQALGEQLLADRRLGLRIMRAMLKQPGRLELGYLKLDRVPPGISQVGGVSALELAGNLITELNDEIGEMADLEELNLGSCSLERVTPALAKLTKLRQLHLSYNRELESLPEVFGGMKSLEHLEVSGCPIGTLPPSIGALESLHTLSATGSKLTELPHTIGGLKSLTSLYLSGNVLTELPPEIGELDRLRWFELSDNKLKRLPDEIGGLTALSQFRLAQNQLGTLPETIGELTALEALDLSKNELSLLPDAFEKLTKLRFLTLNGNELTDLPPSLRHCQALEDLKLASNKIKAIPEVIFHLRLKDGTGIPGPRNPKIKDRLKFIRSCHQGKLEVEVIKRVYGHFLGQETPREVHFEALQVPTYGDKVLKNIFLWPESGLEDHPLRKGSVVAFEGKTAMTKSAVRAKLKEVGLSYSPKITKEVTHVVLGTKPKDIAGLASGKHAYIAEQEMVEFLDRFEEHFLLEEEAAQEGVVQNVEELLRSEDEANVALGLELLESGGVPETVITDLFVIAKLHTVNKLKTKARKLLELHGTAEVRKALKDRSKMYSDAYKGEKLTEEALLDFQRSYPSLDWLRVAYEMIRLKGHGFRFLYDRAKPGHPLLDTAIRTLLEDGVADFGAAYMGYTPHYRNAYAYYYAPFFPTELLDLPGLIELRLQDCALTTLPEEIGLATSLRRLNLRSNELKDLPESLANLPYLEELNLGNNRFDEVPAVLAKCTNLKKLDITQNRKETEDAPLEVPQAIRQALEGCTILDG